MKRKKSRILHTVFEGKNKGYYAWVKRNTIQIDIIEKTEENYMEVQKYIEYLFKNTYVGMMIEGGKKDSIRLENVECFYF